MRTETAPFQAVDVDGEHTITVSKLEILKLALDLLEFDRSPMRRCLLVICERWVAGDDVETLRREYLHVGEENGSEEDTK